jgi:hypothetical protein
MGIFDFLGDLSSKRSKELGLGGLQSLLGTRGAAQAGATGDEMMKITGSDSLPGYFNEQTREYVPWYVDLFDGGGLNKAGGQAQEEAAKSGTAGVTPGGAPMAQPGLLANNQLSDMERANRSRASQMPPSLGSQLSDMEMANRNRAGVSLLSPDAIYSARVDEANRAAANAIANQKDPRLSMQSTGYGRSATVTDFLDKKTDLGAAGYGPMGQASAPSTGMTGIPGYTLPPIPQAIPASGGDMAINTPAAQNRDQMIANQQMYNEEQAMKSHPLYSEYVDFLNRSKVPSTPSLFQQYINTFGNM